MMSSYTNKGCSHVDEVGGNGAMGEKIERQATKGA